VIRIGFESDELPFAYLDQEGDLVGFDIDMAHQLSRDLSVRIEFVPSSADVVQSLRDDEFDVAMSGFEGTVRRATELPHVPSYMDVTMALIVPDYRRREFRTREQLQNQPGLRLAVVADSAASELSAALPSDVEVVEIPTERVFFEADPPVADVLATSAEAGSAWTLECPQFAVVKPTGLDVSVPLYYLVEKESQFEEFLENWLALKRRNGTIERLYDYWILGKDERDREPRWCILRDVLHGVE
jgi:ABC-type amino acid transport substrate-binding protein